MKYVEKTEEFLKHKFNNSNYFSKREIEKNYRLEHSYRVANIAGRIAQKEGLDKEGLIISGLLHDISYCEEFKNETDWKNHGRASAQIARPFLEELGMSPNIIQEICYGIAIHVDGKADFEGNRTPFAMSVGDADNIDRFDVYRIYEGLEYEKFSDLSLQEKKEKVTDKLRWIDKCMKESFGTLTAKEWLNTKLDLQKDFYEKLLSQLENSMEICCLG